MEFNKQTSTVRSSASEAIIDQGLRSYMLKVYNYMASGVLLTGFIALAFFKMAVVTSSEGQIIGLTNFGKYNLRFGTKMGDHVGSFSSGFLYELWNTKNVRS
jgi:hypothetical protein